jgi:hypothetical protein
VQPAQRRAIAAAVSSVARSLAGPNGANTEYDRALVDLTAAVLGVDRAEVAGLVLAPGSPLRNDRTPGHSPRGE